MTASTVKELRRLQIAEGEFLEYFLERKKRRTLGVYVFPDGRVVVRIPLRASVKEAEAFLASRLPWVVHHRQRATERQVERIGLFDAGAQMPFLGKSFPLVFSEGKRPRISLDDDHISVVLPESLWGDEEALQRRVQQWRVQEAKTFFPQRLDVWYQSLAALGLPYPDLKVRHMKTRWGSCSSKAVITLNAELMKMPVELIDYVVVHELCHLREFNHGPRFYALMTRFMPDWQERRAALKARARQELAC